MDLHAVVQREEETAGGGRDGAVINSNNRQGRSPPFSPTTTSNSHRPIFNSYNPPTPAALPLPPHVAGPPSSPRGLVHQSPYSSAPISSAPHTEYQPTPTTQRAYYDPTSDSTPTHATYAPPSSTLSHSHPVSQSPAMPSAASPMVRQNGTSSKQEPLPPASVSFIFNLYHIN